MRLSILIALSSLILASCTRESDDRLIQSAIEFEYPSIYKDISELQQDYPGFSPRVRRWSDRWIFVFGEGLYAVRLPEEEVLVTANGIAKTTRGCGGEEADCELVVPAKPELDLVGTVQLGDHDYAPAEGIEVVWEGAPGYTYTNGHCFAAFKASTEALNISISAPGHKPLVIGDTFGARLVAVTLSSRGHHYSSMRIPKSMFEESKACAAQARAAWPNVGGWAWKR